MGTTVSSGQGTFLVEKTGESTKMGKIAERIQEKEEDTPLQKQLKIFSNQLIKIIVPLALVIFIIGVTRNLKISEIFVTSVALAVSGIP